MNEFEVLIVRGLLGHFCISCFKLFGQGVYFYDPFFQQNGSEAGLCINSIFDRERSCRMVIFSNRVLRFLARESIFTIRFFRNF